MASTTKHSDFAYLEHIQQYLLFDNSSLLITSTDDHESLPSAKSDKAAFKMRGQKAKLNFLHLVDSDLLSSSKPKREVVLKRESSEGSYESTAPGSKRRRGTVDLLNKLAKNRSQAMVVEIGKASQANDDFEQWVNELNDCTLVWGS